MRQTDENKTGLTEPQEQAHHLPSSPVILVWSDALGEGEAGRLAGEGHLNSLQPQRLCEGYQWLKAVGALEWPALQIVPPDESLAEIDTFNKFHDSSYCQTVVALNNGQVNFRQEKRFGFCESATTALIGMAEVARQYVAAARTAVRLAASHATVPIRVVSLAGQQVHAHTNQAQSCDIFNDVALALLDAHALGQKVAFINLDAEHPIVIQDFFFKQKNVMTISLHEGPAFLYPGTGNVPEIGKGLGRGFNVNLPLPPGAVDAQMLQAFKQVVEPLLTRFEADLVILLGGASAHISEPLAHLRLTSHGYQQLLERVARSAPRFVLLGGNGTKWEVSARLWTLAVATLAGQTMITDNSTSFLPHLGLDDHHASRQALHDPPLPALPKSMEEYVDEMLHMTLQQAQQLLFPLWKIPISIENKSIAKKAGDLYHQITASKEVREARLKERYAQANPIRNDKRKDLTTADHSATLTYDSDPQHVAGRLRRNVPRDSDDEELKDKQVYVEETRHERSNNDSYAPNRHKRPTNRESAPRNSQTRTRSSDKRTPNAPNSSNRFRGSPSTTDRQGSLRSSRNSSIRTNQSRSKSRQESKKQDGSSRRKRNRRSKKRGGGKL